MNYANELPSSEPWRLPDRHPYIEYQAISHPEIRG